MPCAASRSIRGVGTPRAPPYEPISPQPRLSASMTTMFGLCAGGAAAHVGAGYAARTPTPASPMTASRRVLRECTGKILHSISCIPLLMYQGSRNRRALELSVDRSIGCRRSSEYAGPRGFNNQRSRRLERQGLSHFARHRFAICRDGMHRHDDQLVVGPCRLRLLALNATTHHHGVLGRERARFLQRLRSAIERSIPSGSPCDSRSRIGCASAPRLPLVERHHTSKPDV